MKRLSEYITEAKTREVPIAKRIKTNDSGAIKVLEDGVISLIDEIKKLPEWASNILKKRDDYVSLEITDRAKKDKLKEILDLCNNIIKIPKTKKAKYYKVAEKIVKDLFTRAKGWWPTDDIPKNYTSHLVVSYKDGAYHISLFDTDYRSRVFKEGKFNQTFIEIKDSGKISIENNSETEFLEGMYDTPTEDFLKLYDPGYIIPINRDMYNSVVERIGHYLDAIPNVKSHTPFKQNKFHDPSSTYKRSPNR